MSSKEDLTPYNTQEGLLRLCLVSICCLRHFPGQRRGPVRGCLGDACRAPGANRKVKVQANGTVA